MKNLNFRTRLETLFKSLLGVTLCLCWLKLGLTLEGGLQGLILDAKLLLFYFLFIPGSLLLLPIVFREFKDSNQSRLNQIQLQNL